MDQLLYMNHVNIPWFRLADDNYLKYPIPGRGGDSHGQTPGLMCTTVRPRCVYLEGSAAYRAAIRAHYFAFILLGGRTGATGVDSADIEIAQVVSQTPGYMAVGEEMWIYAPAYQKISGYRL